LFACLIVAPQRGYDEPATLSYAISSFCPTSADGLHRGQFQMCRRGGIGPYASSNVRIDKMEINASEAQAAKNRIRLARQEAACACKITSGSATSPST